MECKWDCPPDKHKSHCFLSEERQARMSDAYREGMATALDRPCTVPGCEAQVGQPCWCDVILRATGKPVGELPEPHLVRVLA